MAMALKLGYSTRGQEAIAERPDGTRRRFSPYPAPVLDQSGKMIGGINMLVDADPGGTGAPSKVISATIEAFENIVARQNLAGFIASRSEVARGNAVCDSCGDPIASDSSKIELHLECYQKRWRMQSAPSELEAWRIFERLNSFYEHSDPPPKISMRRTN